MERQRDEDVALQDFLRWLEDARQEEWTDEPAREGRYFVPQTRLQSYLSPKRVERLLDVLFPGQDVIERPPSRQIIDRYLRVFSILLCIGHGAFIKHFIRFESLQDTKLPFGSPPSSFPRSADHNLFEPFQQRQWEFCCPTFIYDMRSHYESERILPITRRENIASGGSAIIYRICIEEEYNDIYPPKWKERGDAKGQNTFVLKSYRTRDAEKYFEAERKAYMMLRHASEPAPNIVAYFGSYFQDERYNAILEHMDMNSLEEYMKTVKPPAEARDIIALWEGLFGIARALTQIHGLRLESTVGESHMLAGWHQDIKPSNILVKSNATSAYEAHFKLADLGLSQFKKATSSSMTVKDSFGTRAYGPPEAFRPDKSLSKAHLEITRTFDIWSLGCVYSEMASWVTGGYVAVEEYRNRRHADLQEIIGHNAGHIFHDGSHILPTVLKTHDMIREIVRKGDKITGLVLEMIEHDMLVREGERVAAKFLFQKSIKHLHTAKKLCEENDRADTHSANGTDQSPIIHSRFSSASTALTEEPNLASGPVRLTLNRIHDSGSSLTEAPIQLWRSCQSLDDVTKFDKESNNDVISSPRVPSLSVSDGLLWKERRKKGEHHSTPHSQLLSLLKDRDHVFIIDNSLSMEPYREQIRRLLELLVYMTKESDPDGVDIVFTSGQVEKSVKTLKTIGHQMDKVDFSGFTDMSHCLGKILQKYQIDWSRPPQRSNWWRKPRLKQLSVYVLTDGVWQPHNDVSKVIKALITHLGDLSLQLNQVGISFIQFGDSPLAKERLHLLDSQEPFTDILDVTPSNGNVMKMLLGSLNHWYDDDHWQDDKSY